MLRAALAQQFPPKPTFTEKDVPPGSCTGKVFIITGANRGIGYELTKLLYPSGATIYLASRSQERVTTAIEQIVADAEPTSTPATLKFLHLDLADLTTVKASAATFAFQEKKLDVLWNNAALGGMPVGSTTAQKIETHIGVNCIAPLLFTQELLPQLKEAARTTTTSGSVRVIWSGSQAIEMGAPRNGVDYALLETGATTNPFPDYAASKAGNFFLAAEGARRWKEHGIVSVVQNPGLLKTNIYEHVSWLAMLFVNPFLHPPTNGAYTMLFAAFTPEIDLDKHNGSYIRPFGIVAPHGRQDVYKAAEEGGATKFWEWCEQMYKPYV